MKNLFDKLKKQEKQPDVSKLRRKYIGKIRRINFFWFFLFLVFLLINELRIK